MIQVAVLDLSAEARSKLSERVTSFLFQGGKHPALLSQVSVRSVSLQEIKYQSPPDMCIVGQGIIDSEIGELKRIRELWPSSFVWAQLAPRSDLDAFQEIIHLGAHDAFFGELVEESFLRRLILLLKTERRSQIGTLIVVDSGKGGLGVTTTVAALGSKLYEAGHKVALIDLDTETQDLSRFLRVRPFVNESLQLLLSQSRPVMQEFVDQCLVPLSEDKRFVCMPPPPDQEGLYDVRSPALSSYGNTVHAVLSSHDIALVDVGGMKGPFLKSLYRNANKVLFVMGSDPASLHASVDKIRRLLTHVSAETELLVVENVAARRGLPSAFLRDEFLRHTLLDAAKWCSCAIPYSPEGARWPGSNDTLFQLGGKKIKSAFTAIAVQLSLIAEQQKSPSRAYEWMERLREPLQKYLKAPRVRGQILLPAPKVVTSEDTSIADEQLISGAKIY
jgi:MinD-like ATPase involved in chromosome partitioning or flagellar assembly